MDITTGLQDLQRDASRREAQFDQMAQALLSRGYAVVDQALLQPLALQLRQRVLSLPEQAFSPAGVGRQGDYQKNRRIRGDSIHWLNGADISELQYLAWMEALRVALNKRLFLGLFDYECHFARYPSGSYYQKHFDAFRGRSNRVLSTVFYLNPDWQPADGGHLLIYDEWDQLEARVNPALGSLVVFLSEKVPHEVTVARRMRYSVAGWFRVNASLGSQLDPPH